MLRFTPNPNIIALFVTFISSMHVLLAQPNGITNPGFETSSSAVTGWNTSNLSGTSTISTSVKRSGNNSFTSNNSSTSTTGYVQANTAVSVPSGKYLILMGYYQVSARASNSRVSIGVNGNMRSAVTPADVNTFYLITHSVQNTSGSTVTYNPRFTNYSSNGTQSRNFYWDDMVAYVSNSSTPDVTEPDAPSDATSNYTGSAATIRWANGTDDVGGSGIARTIILRTSGACSTAPVLADQVVYSKSGGYGLNTVGSWTILDTVNGNVTSFTDNTISSGTTYTYAIIHEDLAYNHSPAVTITIPVAAVTSAVAPTNGQTSVNASALNLSWGASCGAEVYDIYLSTNQSSVNSQNSAVKIASNISATTYAHNVLLNGSTTYYWRVVAKNLAGNEASGSTTWSFTTALSPLNFTISRSTDISYTSILNSGNSFNWSGTYNADDKMSDVLDLASIGFGNFMYQGVQMSSLRVNTNGFITFNTSSSASYTNNFSGQTLLVAPFWEDLVCQGYISGSAQSLQLEQLQSSMKYLVTGAQGNQVLTIEWSEMELYNNAGPSINFQLKLYEQGNKIEFVYGKMFGFIGTVNYTYTYSSGMTASVVSSTPSSGQLVALQLPNELNYTFTNTNNLSELPACYTSVMFVPSETINTYNDQADGVTNDNCSSAITLPIQLGIQNDFCSVYKSRGATGSSGITACSASSPGVADDDVWFKFTVTSPGNYGVQLNSSGGYNGVIQLFSGNCAALTPISCANATGNGLIETITANGLVEGTYFVRVYDANTGAGGSGNFSLAVYSIVTPPTNDNCSGATTLTIGTSVNSGSTSNATSSGVSTTCSGTSDDDVWFKFTATSTLSRIAVNGGTAYNAVVQYFSGTCSSLSSLGCVSTTGAAGEESVDFATTIGSQYFIRVYHSANGATPTSGFTLTVSNPVPNCVTLTSPANAVTNISRTSTNTFSWSGSTLPTTGTKNYTIEIALDPSFNTKLTLTNPTSTSTSYTLAANVLAANTQYFWRVITTNVNGSSSACNYSAFATTTSGVPSCVSGFSPDIQANNVANNLTLSWVAGSGTPTTYDVYLSTTQSLVSSLNSSAKVATVSSPSYNVTGLTNGATYYWSIIAKNASGSSSSCSVNSFSVIAAAPSNDNCSGAITLSTSTSSPLTGTTLNASQSMPATVGTADDDVWYKFTAIKTSHNILVSPVYSFNAVVELYSGNCSALSLLSVVNENGNGESENISASGLTIGQTYYVRVYDFGSTSPSSLTFDISVNDIDLGISGFASPTTNNCGNTTVTVNLTNYSVAAIDFSVNPVTIRGSVLSPAISSTDLPEQVISTGTLLSGATTQVTLTTNYSVINAGYYTYTATATVGYDNNPTNNSKTTRLQQISLPNPFVLSGTGSYCAGGTGVTFTLSGSEAGVSYQLFKDNTAASTALTGTGSSLTFNNVTTDGAYRVVATNATTGCQSYMSASAVVTVNPLWLGFSSNWNDPANWCGNNVPATNSNIIISGSAAFMPALPGNVVVNNLELTESNKRIDLGANTLTVNGAISGSGVIRGGTTSSLVVNGSGNMGTLKLDQTTDGTTNVLRNLTVNIGTGSSSDSLVLGNTVKLMNTLTLTNGTLNANGNLVLVSNSSSTARIASIPATADIKGNVIAQRYVPAVVRRYRMVSPVSSGFTYNDLKDDIFITGTGGTANGFDASPTNSASIFTYQESTTGGRGWKAVTNINQSLAAGRGAIVFVRGDRSLPAPQWYTAPFVAQNQVTMDFVGEVNKGTFTPALTYTNTGVPANDGFNLVGNPYPSPIDWSLISKSNLNSFFYILDPATNGYVAQDGSATIASGQAFFVQANAANPSITFNESNKVSSTSNGLFKTNAAPFTLRLIQDSVNSDMAQLRINPMASDTFNPMEDALKFGNSSINMGFVVNNKQVQINTIPSFKAIADTFVLFVNAPAGNYTYVVKNIEMIPNAKSVWLIDLVTNSLTDLRTQPNYTFSVTSSAASQGNRFLLIVGEMGSSLPVEFIAVKAQVSSNEADVAVTWSTATEKNNEKFIIERSFDNIAFKAVGSVKGAANSQVKNSYNFTDVFAATEAKAAQVDKIYYRIRQVDFSGESKWSNTAAVMLNDVTNGIQQTMQLYPNPAKSFTTLELGSGEPIGNVTLIDITGKVVMEINSLTSKIELDLTALNPGVYMVKCDGKSVQKLVVE